MRALRSIHLNPDCFSYFIFYFEHFYGNIQCWRNLHMLAHLNQMEQGVVAERRAGWSVGRVPKYANNFQLKINFMLQLRLSAK